MSRVIMAECKLTKMLVYSRRHKYLLRKIVGECGGVRDWERSGTGMGIDLDSCLELVWMTVTSVIAQVSVKW